jgi:hypothetical protein
MINALLIASSAAALNLSFDPSKINGVITANASKQEVIREIENPKKDKNEADIEILQFVFVAWAYAYEPINIVVSSASVVDAKEIAQKFILGVNNQLSHDDLFLLAPENPSEVNLMEVHKLLTGTGNQGPIFILSRLST